MIYLRKDNYNKMENFTQNRLSNLFCNNLTIMNIVKISHIKKVQTLLGLKIVNSEN